MSGKKIMDRDKLLEFLREGLTPGQIIRDHWAEICTDPKRINKPPSRQAISNIKNDAIEKGELPESLRGEKAVKKLDKTEKRVRKALTSYEKIDINILKNLSPDQLDEVTIRIIKWAYSYPEMRLRINELENQLASTNEIIKQQESKLRERKDRETALEAAKRGALVTHGD